MDFDAPKKATFADFKDAAEAADVDLYGAYQGRAYHQGIAVVYEAQADYARFVIELSQRGSTAYLATLGPHTDNLGLNRIASWPRRLFTEDSYEQAQRFEKEQTG